jgi:hypothetical protein
MIIHQGIVVRAPFPRFVGKPDWEVALWAATEQATIAGLDYARLVNGSGVDGCTDSPDSSPSPSE